MATTDKAPITLSSDKLDMDLFRLLLTKYVVVTEQRDGKVIYELNSIEHHANNWNSSIGYYRFGRLGND